MSEEGGMGGRYTSIAGNNTDGSVHISSYNATMTALQHVTNTGGLWHNEIMDNEGIVGRHTSLVLDAGGVFETAGVTRTQAYL